MRITKGRNRAKKHAAKRTLKSALTVAGDTLKVHLRNNCDTDYEWVNLRKQVGDQIRWISKGPEFTIHFSKVTPFADGQGNKKFDFIVPAKGHVDSGQPIFGQPGEDYEYTVERVALAMSADPGISIRA
jgi:hypothetical protein